MMRTRDVQLPRKPFTLYCDKFIVAAIMSMMASLRFGAPKGVLNQIVAVGLFAIWQNRAKGGSLACRNLKLSKRNDLSGKPSPIAGYSQLESSTIQPYHLT